MKTFLKSVIAGIAILISFILFSFSKNASTNPDFSGTWIINLSKSNFGDSPLYTAPKRLYITQTASYLEMKQTVIDNFGQDSTMQVKLWLNGQSSNMVTADQRTRLYRISWSDDRQVMREEYSSSHSGDSQSEEYHTTEQWKLTPDGKELLLEKYVKVDNDYDYTVDVVYDKI